MAFNYPENIGKGEGGGSLDELAGILKQIDSKLDDLESRVSSLEGGSGSGGSN